MALSVLRLRRTSLRAAALLATAVAFAACDSSTSSNSVDRLDVNPGVQTLVIGQKQQFIATPSTTGGKILDGKVATWSSSTPAVATVDANGIVTGVAGGTSTITATVGDKSATATVNVWFATATVTLAPAAGQSTTIRQEGSVQLNATFTDASGATVTGRQITWSSSNTAVATVNGSGFVAGLTNGTATITATTLDGRSGTTVVTVSGAPVVATVSIAATTNRYIGIGQTEAMVPTVRAASGTALTLTGRTVVWASSNTAVATVDANGVVTMLASSGTSNITLTVDGIAATAVAVVGVRAIATATPITIASAAAGAQTYYGWEVPTGTTSITVTLAGGTGDADLFIYRPGLVPPANQYTSGSWTCVSAAAGNGETCTVAAPAIGRWVLRVDAYEAIANVTITATKAP